jgi:hypothetical protein
MEGPGMPDAGTLEEAVGDFGSDFIAPVGSGSIESMLRFCHRLSKALSQPTWEG